MRLIAHRGNYKGKNVSCENKVKYIEDALSKNFDVEIDLWKSDQAIFLGHDTPDHHVEIRFLENFKERLWIHAKSIETVEFLSKTNFNWFWHENDRVTLTSKCILWTYPEIFAEYSVINQPSNDSSFWSDRLWEKKIYYGICHDDLEFVQTQFKKDKK